MIDETFLTTEEVLEYLQVNLRTVYRLIKAGKIPAVRVGRQWRFRKRDIDGWLDSQRPRSGRAAAPQAAPAPRPTQGATRPRVLVVDDEASIRDLLAKTLALAGCLLAFLLWFFVFMVIAGEWFSMWQSKDWNAQQSSFRFYITVLAVLIFLNQQDPDLPASETKRP